MAESVYLVQCWDEAGALSNNYEVAIGSAAELRALKKFLLTKHSHVLLTLVTRTKATKKRGSK